MRWAALAAVLAGCYSPSPSSGSYLCNADGDCPKGLSCSSCARVCVASPSEDVCELEVSVAPLSAPGCTTDVCVPEHGDLAVTVTARGMGGAPSTYSGPGLIATTWGHARTQPPNRDAPSAFQFMRGTGTATVTVELDRATPHNGTASLGAAVGQTATLGIDTITVNPLPFKTATPVLMPGSATWASTYIGFPAIDRAPSGEYRMYLSGMGSVLDLSQRAKVGIARSPDGTSWSVDANPVFSSSSTYIFAPSTLRVSPTELHLFVTTVTSGAGGFGIQTAKSSDGLTFDNLVPAVALASCDFCTGGLSYPWTLTAPAQFGGEWLLYFSTPPPVMMNPGYTTFGVARSNDSGASWTIAPIPAPASGQDTGGQTAGVSRVLYDDQDGLYRMWYAEVRPGASAGQICDTQIAYATSEDGLLWAGASDIVLTLADAPWASAQQGIYPGTVERDESGGFRLYFSPVENLLGLNICLPKSIGVASTD